MNKLNLICNYCNGEIINNRCNHCNYTLWITKFMYDPNDIKTSDTYLEFLNTIHNKSNIDKSTLEILMEINAITTVMSARVEFIDEVLVFKIANDFRIFNYKKKLEYIFSTYMVNKNEYKRTSNKEITVFKNKKRNFYIEIVSGEGSYFDSDILLYFDYKVKDTIPYNSNLLTKEELESLNESLDEQLKEYLIYSCIDKVETDYFYISLSNYLSKNRDKEISEIHSEIDRIINESIIYFENKINETKEKNKSFFERALLENEIKDF